jgi:hypothetical protein
MFQAIRRGFGQIENLHQDTLEQMAFNAQLHAATVTVRIEADPKGAEHTDEFLTNDPLCGMWRDRDDMAE